MGFTAISRKNMLPSLEAKGSSAGESKSQWLCWTIAKCFLLKFSSEDCAYRERDVNTRVFNEVILKIVKRVIKSYSHKYLQTNDL